MPVHTPEKEKLRQSAASSERLRPESALSALQNSDLLGGERSFVPLSAAPKTEASSFSAGGLSPMSQTGIAGFGAPLQAKKSPQELTEAQKKDSEQAYMEEYRPLSQRAFHDRPTQSIMNSLEPEKLEELQSKADNMGYRFEALKQGEDKSALYEFMMKVSNFSQMGAGYGDYKGKDIQKKDIFTDSIAALMTDEAFASPDFLDYTNTRFNELGYLHQSRFNEASALSGNDKHAQMMKLRADPEFHKYINTASAVSGITMFENAQYGRDLNSEVERKPEYMGPMTDIYHLGWDPQYARSESEQPDIDAGNALFDEDYNSLVAPLEQMPQLPKGVMNHRTGYETPGTPMEAEPKRKHRFRRWLNK